MLEFQRGTQQEREEILQFADNAFVRNQMGFKELIPKVYGEEKNMMGIHHVLREDKDIVGLVGIYEMTHEIAGERLRTAYIGIVSVAEQMRNKGYMRLLMQKADETMRREGIALGILHGRRKRYQFYGYEYGGTMLGFLIDRNTLSHLPVQERASDLVLKEIGPGEELSGEAFAVYGQRLQTGRSAGQFTEILTTWGSRVYEICEKGECIGYFSISRDGSFIQEIEVKDYSCIGAVLYACMESLGTQEIKLQTGIWETAKNRALDELAEDCQIRMAEQYRIYDYEKVLKVYLKLKMQYAELEEGELVLGIREEGNYRIEVRSKEVYVNRTTEKADVVMEAMEAVRTLTTFSGWELMEQKQKFPRGWFPLPFGIAEADTF